MESKWTNGVVEESKQVYAKFAVSGRKVFNNNRPSSNNVDVYK